MVPKGLNACLTFVHAAETANSRCGTNSSPPKVWHFWVSPNSIKIAPKLFFLEPPTESEVLLCWGRCTKMSTFWGDPPTPLKHEISTLPTKSQTFHTINIFSDSPEGFAFFWASGEHFQRTWPRATPFSASECAPKWFFFPKDRT